MVKFYVWNETVFGDVQRFLEFKYSGDPLFSDTVFVLGYNVADCTLADIRAHSQGVRIVVYNMEQMYSGSRWVNDKTLAWLRGADEVWDYDIDNIRFLSSIGIQCKYRPLEYSPGQVIAPRQKDIDILFYGAPTDRRLKVMQEIMSPTQHRMVSIFATGISGDRLNDMVARTRVLLNVHADPRMTRQEQVRMFIPVSSGICVLSETSPYNEFGKAIVEANIRDIARTAIYLVKSGEWENVAKNCAESYRLHCQNRKLS